MLRQVAGKQSDGRWFMPAAERNKDPILAVLKQALPRSGLVLEIGSGTGQHVVHFAHALPALTWQPSDPDAEFRESVSLWIAEAKLENVNVPLEIDVCRWPWGIERADAVISINMIHVAPPAATPALISGAAGLLSHGGVFFLYGPYRRFSRHTAPSNEAFDADLRARNPGWGLRDIEEVETLAREAGFGPAEVIAMPANNFSLLFCKT
jgi:cyclopropane fatty-acyl-phospholipid synthase-like methyltransferase